MSTKGSAKQSDTSSKSAYSSFADVDAFVAKPVVGSDGAALWQEFKSLSKNKKQEGVAPSLPIKQVDKKCTGFQSLKEERDHEIEVRKRAGDALYGGGYTNFQHCNTKEMAEEKKRKKMILERIRPPHKPYFIKPTNKAEPSNKTLFEGWKEDYIFTTRSRGTGYYWDGMDSFKKELSIGTTTEVVSIGANNETNIIKKHGKHKTDNDTPNGGSKKKKRRTKDDLTTTTHQEQQQQQNNVGSNEKVWVNHPMEQVQNSILRRQEALSRPASTTSSTVEANNNAFQHTDTLALTGGVTTIPTVSTTSIGMVEKGETEAGWEMATDATSGKPYYFRRSTGERRWDNPVKTSNTSLPPPTDENLQQLLPIGWTFAKDSNHEIYYYHVTTGKTTWNRPSSSDEHVS